MAENDPTATTRILLVGHCGPDSFMLRSAARRAVPEADVAYAASTAELHARLAASDVLLVNRVLDGDFESDSGIELIRTVLADRPETVALLVSNHDDAQREAESAGARPGFGKANAMSDEAAERLRAAAATA